ncbi:hypothetical protein Psi01_28400 [Planobispora siamensis]|uniref:Uncharacterized protein n=1 Tax=Planobispora siamensis TaxID=936338 RepID=A0A8J3WK40_9ACTN|nr:hypothetical protein Psi01_28400 [Planobispora siamensis]
MGISIGVWEEAAGGIVAVIGPSAAIASAAGAGGRVLMPATPPGDEHAPVSRMAPVTTANRVICPDRMVSTRIRYRESVFSFVTNHIIVHDRFCRAGPATALLASPAAGVRLSEVGNRLTAWQAGSVTRTSRS